MTDKTIRFDNFLPIGAIAWPSALNPHFQKMLVEVVEAQNTLAMYSWTLNPPEFNEIWEEAKKRKASHLENVPLKHYIRQICRERMGGGKH